MNASRDARENRYNSRGSSLPYSSSCAVTSGRVLKTCLRKCEYDVPHSNGDLFASTAPRNPGARAGPARERAPNFIFGAKTPRPPPLPSGAPTTIDLSPPRPSPPPENRNQNGTPCPYGVIKKRKIPSESDERSRDKAERTSAGK